MSISKMSDGEEDPESSWTTDTSAIYDVSREAAKRLADLSHLKLDIQSGDLERVKVRWSLMNEEERDDYSDILATAVAVSLMHKQKCILEYFLDLGADVEKPDPEDQHWRYRPIHMATVQGDLESVGILVERGADVNSRDGDRNTALHWAATHGHSEIAFYLLEHSADPNSVEQEGFTPLHHAACLGKVDICKILLSRGANPNIPDKEGWTPVHTATYYGHPDILTQLLDAGANMQLKNDNSETPVHLAAISEQLSCLSILISRGADLNQKDSKGLTPFFVAVVLGKLQVMRHLILVGADTTTPNLNGLSAFHYAVRLGDIEAIQLMLDGGYNVHLESWVRSLIQPSWLLRQYEGNPSMREVLKTVVQCYKNPGCLRDMCVREVRKLLGRKVHEGVSILPIPEPVKARLLLLSK